MWNGAGAFIACLLFTASVCLAEQAPIPATELAALEQELEQSALGKSAVKVRIAFKDVARQASALLKASPEAPNRYAVIAILFRCQKKLLGMEVTKKNRNALFATCAMLSKAPDEYADLRLEADFLLSERDLAKAEATVTERVRALEEIIEKYRNTSAERRCLRLAMMLASQHRASNLEIKIRKKLGDGRFAGDHEMIALKPLANLNAVFSGTYKSADNTVVRFPSDRLGHQYLVIFWSTKPRGSEGHEAFLARIREQQKRFPGRFEVYSFNLDEMPDAGKSILRQAGVKGMALHLPGGRRHPAYKAYVRRDPAAIFVNAQGHASLNVVQMVPWPRSIPAQGKRPANPGPGLGMWLDDDRYVAQLRSLFIGDFLVADQRPASSIKAIQSCFILPSLRYRLTHKAELDGYRRAEKLCAAAILQNPTAPDIWRVRNRRIIALIGMGNLAREAKYLEEAVKEAKAMLATKLPPGADVVARFCLLKDALWKQGAIPAALLRDFIDAEGGDKAPARALAVAAVLAIEANAEPLYQNYRKRLQCLNDKDYPELWPVLSLLYDRHHNHRMFWGTPGRWGYSETQRYQGRYVVTGVGKPDKANRVLEATFKGLDGRDVRLPRDLAGKMTGIVFVEPPKDAAERSVCANRVKSYAGQFSRSGVPVIVAFLSEDKGAVKSMVKECGGAFRAVMAPGGMRSPLVRRLGILSSDRIPNPFLLNSDGAIAWWISGLTYTVSRTPPGSIVPAAIGININKLRTDRVFQPLQQGDFKRAVLLLSKSLGADYWTADRFQGRALAYMGLNDWKAALADIDAAMSARESASRNKRATSMGEAEMYLAKAMILKKLGRDREAKKEQRIGERQLAWLADQPTGGQTEKPPSYARYGVPVGVYDELLKRVRLKLKDSSQP